MAQDSLPSNATRDPGRLAWLIAVVFFVMVLFPSLNEISFQDDDLWHFPSIYRTAVPDLLDSSRPEQGVPAFNIYSALVIKLFGPRPGVFIALSVLLHIATSFFVSRVAKQMGLSLEVSWTSAILFLVGYPYFGAYTWPMAGQHVLTVFFAVFGLAEFLRADAAMVSGGRWMRPWLCALIVAAIGSLFRAGSAVLPVAVLTHILVSGDGISRRQRFGRWLPLFALFLVFPLADLTLSRADVFARPLARIFGFLPAGHAILFYILSAGTLFSTLIALYFALAKPRSSRIAILCLCAFVGAIFALVNGLGIFMRLFMTHAEGILFPFSVIARSPTSLRWNRIAMTPESDFVMVTLAVVMIAFFVRAAFWKRSAACLLTWFALCAMYVAISGNIIVNESGWLIPSRYLYYCAPAFSIIASMFIWDGIGVGAATFFSRQVVRVGLATALAGVFVLGNIMAVREHLFRVRFVNNYIAFAHQRIAHWIGDAEPLSLTGVPPFPYEVTWDFGSGVRDLGDPLRFLLSDENSDQRWLDVAVNDSGANGYVIEERRIMAEGKNLDRFSATLSDGIASLDRGDHASAERLLREAVVIRPYTLQLVLGPRKIAELGNVLEGSDIRAWTERMEQYHHGSPTFSYAQRYAFVENFDSGISTNATIIREEIDDYAAALVALSYLAAERGDSTMTSNRLSEVFFLEPHGPRLYRWLLSLPAVENHEGLQNFIRQNKYRLDPLDQATDR